MIRRAACVMIVLCVAFGVQAQTVRLKQFMNPHDKGDKALNEIYLAGVKDGLEAFNASLILQGAPPAFCQPSNFALTSEQAADILTREAKKIGRNIDDVPIAIFLLEGLKETFPCGGH